MGAKSIFFHLSQNLSSKLAHSTNAHIHSSNNWDTLWKWRCCNVLYISPAWEQQCFFHSCFYFWNELWKQNTCMQVWWIQTVCALIVTIKQLLVQKITLLQSFKLQFLLIISYILCIFYLVSFFLLLTCIFVNNLAMCYIFFVIFYCIVE